MLNEEICKLRDKLNKSIENGDSYDVTLDLSVQLDELIAKYYRNLGKDQNSPICECVKLHTFLFCTKNYYIYLKVKLKYYIIFSQVKENKNVSKP